MVDTPTPGEHYFIFPLPVAQQYVLYNFTVIAGQCIFYGDLILTPIDLSKNKQFKIKNVAVNTLLRSWGIYILNGFDEELDDTFNDKHIELWSVKKALFPENDDFLNCAVLESLLEYA